VGGEWTDRRGGRVGQSKISGRGPGKEGDGTVLTDCYLDAVEGLVCLFDLKRSHQRQSEKVISSEKLANGGRF
jgi:hypothetical protein